jgi:hypothetical protein
MIANASVPAIGDAREREHAVFVDRDRRTQICQI